jgi:hypothetical protein
MIQETKTLLSELDNTNLEKVTQFLTNISQTKVYQTIGVYNDNSQKTNFVENEHLSEHIAYNLIYRPGRAFFVNGICLNKGYLDNKRVGKLETELQQEIKQINLNNTKPSKIYN